MDKAGLTPEKQDEVRKNKFFSFVKQYSPHIVFKNISRSAALFSPSPACLTPTTGFFLPPG